MNKTEYNLIHNYVKNGGNINALCIKLKYSKRTNYNERSGYRAEGEAFFIHGNRRDSLPLLPSPIM